MVVIKKRDVASLQVSDIWINTSKLRNWFGRKWLPNREIRAVTIRKLFLVHRRMVKFASKKKGRGSKSGKK